VYIMIDPGHGGKDPGAIGPTGLYEKSCTLAIALKVGATLAESGVTVGFTRTTDVFTELSDRAAKANTAGADYFVSIHINSATNAAANGTETYAYATGGKGEKLAKAIQANLVSTIGLTDRGAKTANFAVLRETKMPAALTEVCFINNPAEEALLKTDAFISKAASGIASGILAFLEITAATPVQEDAGTLIVSAPRATVGQAQAWAKTKGTTDTIISLAPLYWEIAPAVGVDPVGAFFQCAHETGYGKFTGYVKEDFCNPCGLKITVGGSDTDPDAHQRFASWREGVTAHVDHIALYAGVAGYPKANTPDPRHFKNLLGQAPTFELLGTKWATAAYGGNLIKLMNELIGTAEPAPAKTGPPESADAVYSEAWNAGYTLGLIDGTRPKEAATRQEIMLILGRLGLLDGGTQK